MPVLDESLALDLAEQGRRLAPLDRAVLLAATLGELAATQTADLPLDRRDRLLIDARIAAFGPGIGFFARCPHCGEGSEGNFDLGALPVPQGDVVTARVGGRRIAARAPTSRAVAEAALSGNPDLLLAACFDDARLDPAAAEAALGDAFPLLDVRFDLVCQSCEADFDTRFDIAHWLWGEIEAMAEVLLDAVDRLARAYGWGEQEILALGPGRRAAYLERVAA